jgi:hypothetical protein
MFHPTVKTVRRPDQPVNVKKKSTMNKILISIILCDCCSCCCILCLGIGRHCFIGPSDSNCPRSEWHDDCRMHRTALVKDHLVLDTENMYVYFNERILRRDRSFLQNQKQVQRLIKNSTVTDQCQFRHWCGSRRLYRTEYQYGRG